jgi:preprotein translocase subunit SecE
MLGVQVPPGLPFFLILRIFSMEEIKEKVKVTIEKVTQFLKEAKVELKKVTWPTPKQAMASTAVVIILVFIVAIILGIIDFALAKTVKFILG